MTRDRSPRGAPQPRRCLAAGVLACALLAPSLGWAQSTASEKAPGSGPPDTAQVALQAADVLEKHCADVASERATVHAQALSAVGPVLADVSAAHDASGESFLLYWRGRLNLCLNQDDRAVADLRAFVADAGGAPGYSAQVREARTLLLRVEQGVPEVRNPRNPSALVVGALLAGGSGVLGGLSGWQWQAATDQQLLYVAGEREWELTQQHADDALDAQIRSQALLGTSVGLGVGGLVSFVIAAVAPVPAGVALMATPTPDGGFALSFGGSW